MSGIDSSSLKRTNEATTSQVDEQPSKRLKETTIAEAEEIAQTAPEGSADAAQRAGKRKKGDNADRRKNTTRPWGCGTRPEGEEPDPDAPKTPRLPKRQCALLLGFSGTGYSGMQIQPLHTKTRTIENVLFDALVEAGAVSQDNADDPVKINIARAARTDAGVHAAGNVVSLKMITAIPGVPDMVEHINKFLPPQIRVWSFGRTQNSFNARTSCDSRKYTYFFPSHLLIPPKPESALHRVLHEQAVRLGLETEDSARVPFWNSVDAHNAVEDLQRKRQWRIDAAQLAELRQIAARYDGTHNFHNFTIGRAFGDAQSKRFMKKVLDPEVHNGTEWLPVTFHGQSFMLHQRKMMCALVLSCRCRCPPLILDELFGPRRVFVPKMPALGLLLEYPIFDVYNGRMAKVNENLQPTDDTYRPPIDFEVHRETMEAFKQQHIYENMRTIEERDGIFDGWIRTIDAYAGNDLLWLNGKGMIPPEAVIHKEVGKRANAFKEKKRFDTTDFSKPVEDDEGEYDVEGEESAIPKKHLSELEE